MILGLLKLIGPVASLIVGLGGGGLVMGAGFWIYNKFIENPRIIAVERERVTALVEKAAADARRIEQERQIRIADAAMQRAAEAQAELEAQHQSDLSKITEEAKRYASERAAGGRACPIDARDLEFLNGVQLRGPVE